MRGLLLIVCSFTLALTGCQTQQEKPVNKEAQVSPKPLTGFMGVPWGDSIGEAKKRIAARKEGAALYRETPFVLLYRDGYLLGEHVDLLRFYFYSKGFYSATAHFTTLNPPEIDRFYQKLKSTITTKYGEPYADSPVPAGTPGICRWRFSDDCVITVEYSPQGIGIYYLNMKMSGEALVEEKELGRNKEEEKDLQLDL